MGNAGTNAGSNAGSNAGTNAGSDLPSSGGSGMDILNNGPTTGETEAPQDPVSATNTNPGTVPDDNATGNEDNITLLDTDSSGTNGDGTEPDVILEDQPVDGLEGGAPKD